jgi:hypothetical protein
MPLKIASQGNERDGKKFVPQAPVALRDQIFCMHFQGVEEAFWASRLRFRRGAGNSCSRRISGLTVAMKTVLEPCTDPTFFAHISVKSGGMA